MLKIINVKFGRPIVIINSYSNAINDYHDACSPSSEKYKFYVNYYFITCSCSSSPLSRLISRVVLILLLIKCLLVRLIITLSLLVIIR